MGGGEIDSRLLLIIFRVTLKCGTAEAWFL
jgi:hypothetical protein